MRDDYVPTGRALKAIRHLETKSHGTEVSGPDLASVAGMLASGVPPMIERSLFAGYVEARRHGNVTYYRLGGTRLPPDTQPSISVRVSIWSGGGLLVHNGAATPLTDQQRRMVLDAVGAS